MNTKNIFIIFFALFAFISSFANEPGNDVVENDTTEVPPSAIKWYTELELANPAIAKPQYIDTSLIDFQKFDFAHREIDFIANKGLAGHASKNLVFNPINSKPHKFSYFQDNPYKGYLFSHDLLKFYRPEHVFTDIYYVTGGSAEQLFYAKHAQRFSEQIVGTIKYQVNRSIGEFDRLECINNNFYATFDFTSKNERYQLLASFVKNTIQNQESGGLEDHIEFEEEESDLVKLSDAVGMYNENAINLRHYYQLGFYREEDDNQQRFVNFGRISHQFSYSKNSRIFEQNQQPFQYYFENHPRIDSTQTFDSTTVHNFTNRIAYSNYRFGDKRIRFPLFFNVYLEHNHFNIVTDTLGNKNEFNQLTQGLDIHTDKNRLLSFKGNYKFTINGYNDQDLSVMAGGHIGEYGKHDHWLEFDIAYHEKEAPYIMNNFSSNYVSWENNFNKSKISQASFKYGNTLLTTGLKLSHLTDWHYFDKSAIPQQADKAFHVITGSIKTDFNVGVVGMSNHIVYQYLSDKSYEQFPELLSYNSIYADLVLFDKALYSRIGIDANYNSPYYPQSYMPVHMHFYLQDEYKTNHQFFVNAFINAKISRVRLFLKWQNIGSLIWEEPEYYKIPFYPIPKAEIRFGVSWMFYD